MNDNFVDPGARLVLLSIGGFMMLWAVILSFCPAGIMYGFTALIFKVPPEHNPFRAPLLMYMIRVSGALYGFVAASFLVAAQDPARHRPWVRLSGIMLVLLGLFCLVSGWVYAMPRFMYGGDAVLAWLGAFFVLRFALPPRGYKNHFPDSSSPPEDQ